MVQISIKVEYIKLMLKEKNVFDFIRIVLHIAFNDIQTNPPQAGHGALQVNSPASICHGVPFHSDQME